MHDIDGPGAGKPDAPQMEMPRYVSHKKIWALEIDAVGVNPNTHGQRWLEFVDIGYAGIWAAGEMFSRYVPVPGDFYVVYADGYKSFSPRKAFLEGYKRDEVTETKTVTYAQVKPILEARKRGEITSDEAVEQMFELPSPPAV